MALPSDLTTITVTGTYATITGSPLTGQVNFSLTTPVEDSTGKVIFNAFTQSAALVNGSFSIVLPCTDNSDLNPANFSYLVTEVVPGLGRAYYIQLPHTLGSTVDLSALAPVSAPPPATAFASANTWTATQTFSGNPPLAAADYPATGLAGATAASRYAGATASGSPISGTFATGDFVIDQSGKIWICTAAGSPGTWAAAGASIPLTTLGDMLYENGTPALARLPGNTTATKNFLTQAGTGTVSAAPAWGTIQAGDVPDLAYVDSVSAADSSITVTGAADTPALSSVPAQYSQRIFAV